jgi:membrane protease YdiL (CAAX protease family)
LAPGPNQTKSYPQTAKRTSALAVKCGARGALVQQQTAHGIQRDGVTPLIVDPIDTIGAGDSFNAGFLHAWLQSENPLRAATFGNLTGALSTLRPGGTEAFREAALRAFFLQHHLPSTPYPASLPPARKTHTITLWRMHPFRGPLQHTPATVPSLSPNHTPSANGARSSSSPSATASSCWSSGHPLYILAALVIAAIFCIGYTTPKSMGLRTKNFLRSLWIVGIALLISAAAIGLAINFQTLHPIPGPIAFFKRYWGYALWSFVQQLLLQDFFLRRLRLLLPSAGLAALAAAAIFSIAHIPSPVLMLVTFFMGLAACLLFLRYRNLYPLAIAHAILGITLAITLPNSIIRNMRVGLGYLTYTKQQHPHRNHNDHVASTSACVIPEATTRRC